LNHFLANFLCSLSSWKYHYLGIGPPTPSWSLIF
jgi:hypothetical protein